MHAVHSTNAKNLCRQKHKYEGNFQMILMKIEVLMLVFLLMLWPIKALHGGNNVEHGTRVANF